MSTHILCFEQKHEKFQNFLSENFHCLVVKFSIYFSKRVFVMFQVSDQYMDGDDYGELFTTFVLNISAEDLENITFDFVERNTTKNEISATTPSEIDSNWTIVLNVISGIGILTNCILLFMIVIDLVLDKQCRKKPRHWLIFHSSIIHTLYLINAISLNGISLDVRKDQQHLKIWIHLANTFEIMVNMNLILYGMKVILKCFKQDENKGYRHVCFWIVLMLLTWLIGNLFVYSFITSELTAKNNDRDENKVTPLRMFEGDENSLFTVMFALPYVISIVLLLTSIIFRAMNLKYSVASSPRSRYIDNGIESDAILFLSVLVILGLFSVAPYFIFRLNDVYHIPTNSIHVYYVIVLLNIVYYVAFPVVTLCLHDVRTICHKLLSPSANDLECLELE